MTEIKLNDLFHFTEEEMESVKIKLNVYNGYVHPLDEYKKNPEIINNGWLLFKPDSGKSYFAEDEIAINLIQLYDESNDRWLITTAKKITKSLEVRNDTGYEASEIKKYKQFFGRVIVEFHKNSQAGVFKFSTIADDLIVREVLPAPYEAE